MVDTGLDAVKSLREATGEPETQYRLIEHSLNVLRHYLRKDFDMQVALSVLAHGNNAWYSRDVHALKAYLILNASLTAVKVAPHVEHQVYQVLQGRVEQPWHNRSFLWATRDCSLEEALEHMAVSVMAKSKELGRAVEFSISYTGDFFLVESEVSLW